jgi:hypothetical protein
MTRILTLVFCLWTVCARASDFETIGLVQLRLMVPSLTGSGVMVAQPEADAPGWQVNPVVVAQSPVLFTWTSAAGSATSFPNAVGSESWHADEVGKLFYGLTNGMAPGLAHVDSYDANYFYNSVIGSELAISAKVVNQSFIFGMEAAPIDEAFDDYAARYGTLFVSGAGNGGALSSPATAYNGIAVGAYGGSSSIGPTTGGRSKPDLTAPGTLTSFSTPLVSGAAALLAQAAARNDAGAGTAGSATNPLTIKVLLLNSATKPVGWTNGTFAPLDARYGAGMLHVGNAYRQLRGGKFAPVLTENIPVGLPHPPPVTSSNLPTRRGWDLQSVSSSISQSGVAHYLFDVTSVTGRTMTATLTWSRHQGQVAINNLDLFLYNALSGTLVASSQSLVDNVEHICATNLPPGRYDLQVLKQGGAGRVTASETYALAFEFGPPVAPTFAGQQIAFGQFQTTVSGEPNQLYAIDRTLDLAAWTAVTTNKTSAAGTFLFVEPATSVHAIFRVREVW